MHCKFHRQFLRDLKKIDKVGRSQVGNFLEKISQAKRLSDLDAEKISGHQGFYRIRVGQYRIGLTKEKNELVFRRVLHRKDIYKKFP